MKRNQQITKLQQFQQYYTKSYKSNATSNNATLNNSNYMNNSVNQKQLSSNNNNNSNNSNNTNNNFNLSNSHNPFFNANYSNQYNFTNYKHIRKLSPSPTSRNSYNINKSQSFLASKIQKQFSPKNNQKCSQPTNITYNINSQKLQIGTVNNYSISINKKQIDPQLKQEVQNRCQNSLTIYNNKNAQKQASQSFNVAFSKKDNHRYSSVSKYQQYPVSDRNYKYSQKKYTESQVQNQKKIQNIYQSTQKLNTYNSSQYLQTRFRNKNSPIHKIQDNQKYIQKSNQSKRSQTKKEKSPSGKNNFFHKNAFLSNKGSNNLSNIKKINSIHQIQQDKKQVQKFLNQSANKNQNNTISSSKHQRSNSSIQKRNKINSVTNEIINQQEDNEDLKLGKIPILQKKDSSFKTQQSKPTQKFKRTKNINLDSSKVQQQYKLKIQQLQNYIKHNKQEYQIKIKQIQTEKNKNNNSYTDLMNKITDKNKQLRIKNQQISQLKQDIQTKNQQIVQLNKKINQISKTKNNSIETSSYQTNQSIKEIIQNLINKNKLLQNQNMSLLQIINQQRKDNQLLENKAKQQQVKLLELQIQLVQIKQKNQREFQAFSQKIKKIKAELEQKDKMLKKFQQQKKYKEQTQSLSSKKNETKLLSRQEQLQKQIRSNQKTISSMLKQIKGFQKDLKNYNYIKDQLRRIVNLLNKGNQAQIVNHLQSLNFKYAKLIRETIKQDYL